jgi:hypothetical protein
MPPKIKPQTGHVAENATPSLLSSSNADEDFEIKLAEGGEYTAQGMQLALMQKIPAAMHAQIHIQSMNELRRQFAELVQRSQLQPVVIALNTLSASDAGRAHWSLIVIDKGRACYCNTLASDFQFYENQIRRLAENARAAAFQSFNIEALNRRHEIANVDDMNLGVCGYWVETITDVVLREFDALMQGRPASLVRGLREAINGDFANFVRHGFERWSMRRDSISFSQLQSDITEYGARQAISMDEKIKSHLQLLIKHTQDVNKAIEKLHPDAGFGSLYASISSNFHLTLARENNNDKKSQLTMQHWERMTELMNTALAALKISQEHHLQMPSSFSKNFAAHGSNSKIKDAIAFVEAQAKASLIAFQQLPNENPAAFFNYVIANLKAATVTANNLVLNEKRHALITAGRTLLNHDLHRLLQGKPYFQNILSQARTISESLDYDNVDINNAINKLLFTLYLETYKISREKNLFRKSKIHDEITPWLEKVLVERCPQIAAIVPHMGVNNTPTNRILYFAGERYGEFVNQTRAELLALQEIPEQKDSANENKKRFVNTGKLLGRLGRAGFNASSEIFADKKGQYVKEHHIEKYYDSNVADIVNLNRNRK